jgi:hypothetical protein
MSILDKIRKISSSPTAVSEERLHELEEAVESASRSGAGVLLAKAEDVVPKAWNGFRVEIGIGAYPPDAPGSHRKAIYCKLWPIEDVPRAVCANANADYVLGGVPLTPGGLTIITENPNGPEMEEAMKLALKAAQTEAAKRLPKEPV